MKKFFTEFKIFITRGNVVDMAVGVIVGGAFTAIVNGVSNFVLKPITNWLLALVFSKDSLSELYTMLTPAYTTDEAGNQVLDLANSIYLDWGSLINAIINFFLIALVLFTIVKIINKAREEHNEMAERVKENVPTKEERREMRALGIKLSDHEAVKAFLEEKDRLAAEAAAAAKAEEEAKAAAERAANPTAEDLLTEIRDLLKKD